jgi:hypothetical protein
MYFLGWRRGMILIRVVPAVLLLMSCMARAESNLWFQNTAPEQISAFYEARCTGYGYAPQSVALRDCIVQEIRSARQRNAVVLAGILAN